MSLCEVVAHAVFRSDHGDDVRRDACCFRTCRGACGNEGARRGPQSIHDHQLREYDRQMCCCPFHPLFRDCIRNEAVEARGIVLFIILNIFGAGVFGLLCLCVAVRILRLCRHEMTVVASICVTSSFCCFYTEYSSTPLTFSPSLR